MRFRTLVAALMLTAFSGLFSNSIAQQTVANHADNQSGYHLTKKLAVGGEGGWDYLTIDSAAHRLYISRGTHVMILDIESGKVVGDIPDTNGVHGIALAPELGRGFTSNGRAGTVTIFDIKSLAIIGQVKVGTNPDAIIYDPSTQRVFAFNGGSSDVTAIDAMNGKVAGTLALGGKPEFAVADGRGKIFVNLEDKSQTVAFDSRKLEVLARWSVAPGEEPSGLAMDTVNHRLFVGCANKLMVVLDADNGKVLASLPIGRGVDAVAFDSEKALAFSSNGEGTVTVIHEDSPTSFKVIANVATQAGARTMALDAKSHQIFLATAQFGPTPAATKEQPRPRPSIVANSFVILNVSE